MSVLDQYYAIRSQAQSAIASAQPELADGLKKAIKRSADERVYSYSASPEAMEKRRYQLGGESNLYAVISDDSVEITNETTLQEHPDEAETPWVESGYSQGPAGPRPFMEEALRDFVDSSEAEAIVASALLAAGFEVEAG
mgnify:FL=1